MKPVFKNYKKLKDIHFFITVNCIFYSLFCKMRSLIQCNIEIQEDT